MTTPDHWLLSGGRVVTPHGVLSPGWITVAGDRIDAVGPGDGADQRVPGAAVVDLRGHWVLPGFVDMHAHGGGGTSFTEGTSDDARRAAEFHRGHGSTTMLASLQVTVAGGVARLTAGPGETGPIAGSTATMASVVRHAAAAGLPACDIAAAASTTPARVLGIDDRTGALRPGLAADLVACDQEFRLRAVMARGQWLRREWLDIPG